MIQGRFSDQVIRETGIRRLERKIELLRITASIAASRYVQVTNPSSRLSTSVEVFFEPSAAYSEVAIQDYNSDWWVQARFKGGNTVSDVNGHFAEPDADPTTWSIGGPAPASFAAGVTPRLLPRSWEVASNVALVRIFNRLGTPTSAGPADVLGIWYARGIWEPNVVIEDDELNRIFSKCDIQLTAQVG